jgi:Tol biopolymer transport system component
MTPHRATFVVVVTALLGVVGCGGDNPTGPDPSVPAKSLILRDAAVPSWAPDGRSLLCVRSGASGPQVWKVSDSGRDTVMLIADPEGCLWPLWLPDGNRIVYLREDEFEFVVRDLRDQSSQIWPAPEAWDDYGINLTPDGREILYTVYGSPQHETWALDLTDGSKRLVWAGAGAVFSPDGRWVAFTTRQDSLAIAPVSGGPARRVAVGAFASWTPDSRYVVFTVATEDGNVDLMAVDRDGTRRLRLTDEATAEWGPRVSPDGRRVAYVRCPSYEVSPFDLWIMDLELPPVGTGSAEAQALLRLP